MGSLQPFPRSPAVVQCVVLFLVALTLAACDIHEPFMGLIRSVEDEGNPDHVDDPGQFVETFEGNALGSVPTGWTPGWVVVDTDWHIDEREGRTVLVDGATSTGRRIIVWEDIGEFYNPEVLIRTKFPRTSASQQYIIVRASGDAGSETGYAFQVRNNGIRIGRYNNGGLSTVSGNPEYPIGDPDRWYWMRFQVEDYVFRGKIWPDGESEPEDWSIVRENSVVTRPGMVGVGRHAVQGDALIDYFSVGVGGEPAPMP